MPKKTYGPIVRDRVKRLLEAILDFAAFPNEKYRHIKMKATWKGKKGPYHLLLVETELRKLKALTQKDQYEGDLPESQVREALHSMEDFLGILDDHRTTDRGTSKWTFRLKLWSMDKEENLRHFQKEWEARRSEKSKRQEKAKKINDIESPSKIDSNHVSHEISIAHLSNLKVFKKGRTDIAEEHLEQSLKSSRGFRAYSISLNFLWDEDYYQKFRNHVMSSKSSEVKLCLANPFSPEILLRFIQEGGQPVNIRGIQDRIEDKFLSLEAEIGDKSKFEVRLFDHYPTYSLLIFDDEMYLYLYPFQARGNTSPIFYWKDKADIDPFFHEQFDKAWDSAQSASEVFQENRETISSSTISKVYRNNNYEIEISIKKENSL